MEVLKNIVLNWVLPVVLLVAGIAGLQWLRAPEVALDDGGLAPGFALMDSEGAPVQLADFRGRDVIVNFWGTWCGPCRAELPGLNRFARKNPEVAVLGLAIDSGDPKTLKRAKKKMGIEFTVLEATGKAKRDYGVRSVPTSFHIDPDGVLRHSHVGVITPLQLAAWVR